MTRQECAATVLGGPTTVLDLGGLRIVSDPTFDDPGPHGYLTKTVGPAVTEDQLGPVDLVLISHDNHPDNLDDRGRALALAAPLVLTTRSGAATPRPACHRPGPLDQPYRATARRRRPDRDRRPRRARPGRRRA